MHLSASQHCRRTFFDFVSNEEMCGADAPTGATRCHPLLFPAGMDLPTSENFAASSIWPADNVWHKHLPLEEGIPPRKNHPGRQGKSSQMQKWQIQGECEEGWEHGGARQECVHSQNVSGVEHIANFHPQNSQTGSASGEKVCQICSIRPGPATQGQKSQNLQLHDQTDFHMPKSAASHCDNWRILGLYLWPRTQSSIQRMVETRWAQTAKGPKEPVWSKSDVGLFFWCQRHGVLWVCSEAADGQSGGVSRNFAQIWCCTCQAQTKGYCQWKEADPHGQCSSPQRRIHLDFAENFGLEQSATPPLLTWFSAVRFLVVCPHQEAHQRSQISQPCCSQGCSGRPNWPDSMWGVPPRDPGVLAQKVEEVLGWARKLFWRTLEVVKFDFGLNGLQLNKFWQWHIVVVWFLFGCPLRKGRLLSPVGTKKFPG